MVEVATCRLDELEETPWRNGLGTTRELLVWPEDASLATGDFAFRVSLARIERDAAFSPLPGVDRTMALLAGSPFELDHGDAAPSVVLRPHEVHRYDGGAPTAARGVRGEAEVLNVMVRRGHGRATLEHLGAGFRTRRFELGGLHVVLLVLAGTVTARVSNEDEPLALGADEAQWLHDAAPGEELVLDAASPDFAALIVEVVLDEAPR